jgi:hypothetical protein
MPTLDVIRDLITKGTNQFIAVCTNANRDLPFHDYNFAESTTVQGSYVVGSNNINGYGDQKKHFVSKSTLFFSTADLNIHLNTHNNVAITILANTYYEFKSNIHSIFWDATQGAGIFKMWFEGVMYHEARRPE